MSQIPIKSGIFGVLLALLFFMQILHKHLLVKTLGWNRIFREISISSTPEFGGILFIAYMLE